jgi:hypothetical protein
MLHHVCHGMIVPLLNGLKNKLRLNYHMYYLSLSENVCPANLLCKIITCEQDDDCDPGKKCCDCVGGGTVCSKDNADSGETNSEERDSDSSSVQ